MTQSRSVSQTNCNQLGLEIDGGRPLAADSASFRSSSDQFFLSKVNFLEKEVGKFSAPKGFFPSLDVCSLFYASLEVMERAINPDLVLTKSPVNKIKIFFSFILGRSRA